MTRSQLTLDESQDTFITQEKWTIIDADVVFWFMNTTGAAKAGITTQYVLKLTPLSIIDEGT